MTNEEAREVQEKWNDRFLTMLEKMTDALRDLEKHTADVGDHETRIRQLEGLADFVASARRVFTALIVALVIGSMTAVWQVVKDDERITKADIKEIIAAAKANNDDKQIKQPKYMAR